MAEKITYLLGAGASAKALPLSQKGKKAKSIIDRFIEISNGLDIKDEFGFSKELTDFLRHKLKLFINESQKIGSTIDELAKFYYNNRQFELLEELKIALSLFFCIEQLFFNLRDKRYLSFVNELYDHGQFPSNVKVLNWNYDFQMEFAAENFKEESYHPGAVSVHSPPLIPYYPPVGDRFPITTKQYDPSELSLIHLNGIAGLFHDQEKDVQQSLFLSNSQSSIIERLNMAFQNKNNWVHSLTFAWEKGDTPSARVSSRSVEFAKKLIEETTVVVIVGYSFPNFNDKIDKELFEVVKSSGKLKKIIVQDPNPDSGLIRDKFKLSEEVKIVPETNLDKFFVPHELNN